MALTAERESDRSAVFLTMAVVFSMISFVISIMLSKYAPLEILLVGP